MHVCLVLAGLQAPSLLHFPSPPSGAEGSTAWEGGGGVVSLAIGRDMLKTFGGDSGDKSCTHGLHDMHELQA